MYTNIKTFEDALQSEHVNMTKEAYEASIASMQQLPEWLRGPAIAATRLMIIQKAINEGWEADYTTHSQYKYFPWFYIQPGETPSAPARFSYYGCGCDVTYTGLGSRLAYESEEKAEYAGTQFLDEYRPFIIPGK